MRGGLQVAGVLDAQGDVDDSVRSDAVGEHRDGILYRLVLYGDDPGVAVLPVLE